VEPRLGDGHHASFGTCTYARAAHITLAQHALTSPFAQHALTSPLHGTSQVWDQTPRYHDLLDPTQVYFIDDYPSKDDKLGLIKWIWLTVEDNRRNSVSSMLLIDDCASHMVRGDLKIDDMLTNGRSQWLTVITLWQRSIKSNGDGPTIRENLTMIIFFRTRIPSIAGVEVWVPKD
jgi:hypothetical protein